MQEPAVSPVIPPGEGVRRKAKKIIIKLCSLEPKQADALLKHFLERRDAPVIDHYHRDTIDDDVSYETINSAHLVFSDVCNLENRIAEEKEKQISNNDVKIIESCETSAELDRVLKDLQKQQQNEKENPDIERAAHSFANGQHYDLKSLDEKKVAKSIARNWMLDKKLQAIWQDQSLHGDICLSAVNFGYTKTARRILDNITKEQAAMANAKAALKEKFNSKVWLAQWRADHPDEWSSNRDRDLVTAIKLWSDSSFFKNGYQRKVNKFSGFQIARFVRAERFKLIWWHVDAEVIFDFKKSFPKCSSMKDNVILLAHHHLKLFLKTRMREIIEGEMRNWAAIVQSACFSMNFSSLIERMPLSELPSLKYKNYVVVGVDPAWKNTCRTVILDTYGDLYVEKGFRLMPTRPWMTKLSLMGRFQLRRDRGQFCRFRSDDDLSAFLAKIREVPVDFKVVFVVGNGRYSREARWCITKLIREKAFGPTREMYFCVVDECGATRYSETNLAREELPTIDGVFRGAVSIARRAISPASEYLKISPQHIGLGEYQMEIEQLKKTRELAVKEHITSRGLDVNTASKELLMIVLDKNQEPMADLIISERSTKSYALDVDGFKEILPNAPTQLLEAFKRHDQLFHEGIERQTALTLMKEPAPPEKLKPGEIVHGIVRNVTDFGTFIDIDESISAFFYDPQSSNPHFNAPKQPKILNIGVRVVARIEEVDGEKVSVCLKKSEFPDHAFNQRARMRLDEHKKASEYEPMM